jgi:hypothetical protein
LPDLRSEGFLLLENEAPTWSFVVKDELAVLCRSKTNKIDGFEIGEVVRVI